MPNSAAKKAKRKAERASKNASVNSATDAGQLDDIDEESPGGQEEVKESELLDANAIAQNMVPASAPANTPDSAAVSAPSKSSVDVQTLLQNQLPSGTNVTSAPSAPRNPDESFGGNAPSSAESIRSMMNPSSATFNIFDGSSWSRAAASRDSSLLELGASNPSTSSSGYPMSMSASGGTSAVMERKGGELGRGVGVRGNLVVDGQRIAAGANAYGAQPRAPHVHLIENPNIPRPFYQPLPDTTPDEERAERDLSYMVGPGPQRILVRFMLTPRETKVHTVICYLNPATNGVREKDRSIRGVIQGDMVYHNFSMDQTLVAANTRIPQNQNVELGISLVTQGEIVEGDTINYPIAVSGALTAIFRGFKVVDPVTLREEYATCAPGERFGLDLSSAAVETGNTDRVRRVVHIHRIARGRAGFCSSLNTALGIGYPGFGLEIIRDY